MMKKLTIFAAVLLAACGGGAKKAAVADEPTEERDFFVFEMETAIKSGGAFETFNELIDSVRFIPLETTEKALLPERYQLARLDGDFLISGGGAFRMSPLYRFDGAGRFVEQLSQIGRGPLEVTYPQGWYAHAQLRQVNFFGFEKMVVSSIASGEKWSTPVDTQFGIARVPLRDSTFVSSPLFMAKGSGAQLNFFDRDGNLIHTRKRTDELADFSFEMNENNQTPPYEGYRLWSDYKGDAIFYDIFNDTIYRVRNRNAITPHLVFRRGGLIPRPEDVHNRDNKQRQAYVFGLIENPDVAMLSYQYEGKKWRDVWSKRDGRLLIHSDRRNRSYPFDIFVPYTLPDGNVVDLQIVYADRERIYGVLNALDACKFLPNVKEDDNPVIVIAKLKI